jgi:hypothetical protein
MLSKCTIFRIAARHQRCHCADFQIVARGFPHLELLDASHADAFDMFMLTSDEAAAVKRRDGLLRPPWMLSPSAVSNSNLKLQETANCVAALPKRASQLHPGGRQACTLPLSEGGLCRFERLRSLTLSDTIRLRRSKLENHCLLQSLTHLDLSDCGEDSTYVLKVRIH